MLRGSAIPRRRKPFPGLRVGLERIYHYTNWACLLGIAGASPLGDDFVQDTEEPGCGFSFSTARENWIWPTFRGGFDPGLDFHRGDGILSLITVLAF
jgi:hypothetical protein